MERSLFAGTVINQDGTITCTNAETECHFTLCDPNNLTSDHNALDPRKSYPFPMIYHNIASCECPTQLKQFWHVEYRDNIITILQSQYGGLDIFTDINAIDSFWYGNTITVATKEQAWDRINAWESAIRMLATCKAAMGMYTASKDTTLTASAYIEDGQVLWRIADLTNNGEQEAEHTLRNQPEQHIKVEPEEEPQGEESGEQHNGLVGELLGAPGMDGN